MKREDRSISSLSGILGSTFSTAVRVTIATILLLTVQDTQDTLASDETIDLAFPDSRLAGFLCLGKLPDAVL